MRLTTNLKSFNNFDLLVVLLSKGADKTISSKTKRGWASLLSDEVRSLVKEGIKNLSFKTEWYKSINLNTKVGKRLCSILVLGWESDKRTAERELELGGVIASQAERLKTFNVALVSSDQFITQHSSLRNIIQGIELGGYSFTRYRSKLGVGSKIKELCVPGAEKVAKQAFSEAQIISSATKLARDLVNTPASDCTPESFVAEAKKIARKAGLSVKVYDRAALKRLGAGGILNVGKASAVPPCLLRLEYKARGSSESIALVGKGITFDSGGLSIKTGEGMESMKDDMSGAASVLATISCLKALKINRSVRAYIPLAENMISDNAMRPGDILKFINGKTAEVLNTDAEGRLVLADALSLAEREGASQIIDLATLTGACVVALGMEYAALYANDERLAERLLKASEQAGEKIWRMPLVQSYRSQLDSPIADLKNIGNRALGGGSITAALFLQEFIGKTRWAHLDIAGPAFSPSDKYHIKKGGVGFGVRTLLEYLRT